MLLPVKKLAVDFIIFLLPRIHLFIGLRHAVLLIETGWLRAFSACCLTIPLASA
jgi:hypothetical protein